MTFPNGVVTGCGYDAANRLTSLTFTNGGTTLGDLTYAFDAAGERLFVCALGNNSVEVIDLRKGERIHSITGLASPQGAGYIAQLDRLFVANDKNGLCRIYDAKSFQSLAELSLGDDADNVRCDDEKKRDQSGDKDTGPADIDGECAQPNRVRERVQHEERRPGGDPHLSARETGRVREHAEHHRDGDGVHPERRDLRDRALPAGVLADVLDDRVHPGTQALSDGSTESC